MHVCTKTYCAFTNYTFLHIVFNIQPRFTVQQTQDIFSRSYMQRINTGALYSLRKDIKQSCTLQKKVSNIPVSDRDVTNLTLLGRE
jgi:hypothetical protein